MGSEGMENKTENTFSPMLLTYIKRKKGRPKSAKSSKNCQMLKKRKKYPKGPKIAKTAQNGQRPKESNF